MGYELYETIYKGLNDKSLEGYSLYQFSEEIFHRFYMDAKQKGMHIPYELYNDVKREIMDEGKKGNIKSTMNHGG